MAFVLTGSTRLRNVISYKLWISETTHFTVSILLNKMLSEYQQTKTFRSACNHTNHLHNNLYII